MIMNFEEAADMPDELTPERIHELNVMGAETIGRLILEGEKIPKLLDDGQIIFKESRGRRGLTIIKSVIGLGCSPWACATDTGDAIEVAEAWKKGNSNRAYSLFSDDSGVKITCYPDPHENAKIIETIHPNPATALLLAMEQAEGEKSCPQRPPTPSGLRRRPDRATRAMR